MTKAAEVAEEVEEAVVVFAGVIDTVTTISMDEVHQEGLSMTETEGAKEATMAISQVMTIFYRLI